MDGKEESANKVKMVVTKRRINKPMIERKRRERINECLQQLHTLITEMDGGKQKTNKSKLEKADILEMAVDFVKRSRSASEEERDEGNSSKDPQIENTQDQYMAGFEQCRRNISSMIKGSDNITEELRRRLLQHLQNMEGGQQAYSLEKSGTNESREKEVLQSFQTIKPKSVDKDANEREESYKNVSDGGLTEEHQDAGKTNNANIFICASPLPAYILVPASSICHALPITQQQNGTTFMLRQSNDTNPVSSTSSVGVRMPSTQMVTPSFPSLTQSSIFSACLPSSTTSGATSMFFPSHSSNLFTQSCVASSNSAICPNLKGPSGSQALSNYTQVPTNSSPHFCCPDSMWRPW